MSHIHIRSLFVAHLCPGQLPASPPYIYNLSLPLNLYLASCVATPAITVLPWLRSDVCFTWKRWDVRRKEHGEDTPVIVMQAATICRQEIQYHEWLAFSLLSWSSIFACLLPQSLALIILKKVDLSCIMRISWKLSMAAGSLWPLSSQMWKCLSYCWNQSTNLHQYSTTSSCLWPSIYIPFFCFPYFHPSISIQQCAVCS